MDEVVHRVHRQYPEHWWFRARREIFSRVLDEHVELSPDARILDVGPGSGVNLPVLAPRGAVTVVDIERESALRCRDDGAASVVVGSAEHLPFADSSFDLCCALDVVEHLDDDAAALRDLYRVLEPGGSLLLSVPALRSLWGRQDVLSHHRRRYRRSELADRLEAAGFVIRRLSYFNSVLFLPILAARLIARPFLSRSVAGGRSDFDVRTPFGLDEVLFRLFVAEAKWLPRRDLPVGVSLLAVAGRRE